MYTLNELETLTTSWADARGIIKNGKPTTQALKLVEELGELAAAILRNKLPEAKDGIGDCCVVLNNVAQQLGSSVTECWNLAYEEIKDRKGYLTPEGNFVKEEENAEPTIKAVQRVIRRSISPSYIEIGDIIFLFSNGAEHTMTGHYYTTDTEPLIGLTLDEAITFLRSYHV
jgi:hypothetical protein